MNPEQKQKMYALAMRCVRDDKHEEMKTLLLEADEKFGAGEASKVYWTKLGLRMMAIIKIEHMAEFIKTAKALGKEYGIQ